MTRALVAMMFGACVSAAPSYTCMQGDPNACVSAAGAHGTCEASGNCSFPDASCGANGSRYDASAAPGRAGLCIALAVPMQTFSVPPQQLGATRTIMVEVHNPGTQVVAFDDLGPGTDTAVGLGFAAGPCPPTNVTPAANPGTGCGQPFARFTVSPLQGPNVYCLVAGDGPSGPDGHVALNVYPSIASLPSCAE